MYRKFYKLLIIGNFQTIILLIPTWNDGVLGYWGVGVLGDIALMHGCMDVRRSCSHAIPPFPHSPNPQNTTFQHSIIPIAERSRTKF
jgi:hypothetical protein